MLREFIYMEHYDFESTDVYCSNYFHERMSKDSNLQVDTPKMTKSHMTVHSLSEEKVEISGTADIHDYDMSLDGFYSIIYHYQWSVPLPSCDVLLTAPIASGKHPRIIPVP